LLRPQERKLEARSAESGDGALRRVCYGATGPGSDVSSPSEVPQPLRVLVLLCSQMTSPGILNPACTVQVCHFTHFCNFCGPTRDPQELGARFNEPPERSVSTPLLQWPNRWTVKTFWRRKSPGNATLLSWLLRWCCWQNGVCRVCKL